MNYEKENRKVKLTINTSQDTISKLHKRAFEKNYDFNEYLSTILKNTAYGKTLEEKEVLDVKQKSEEVEKDKTQKSEEVEKDKTLKGSFFGKNLIYLRKRNRLSQMDLAKAFDNRYQKNTVQGRVSSWEKEKDFPSSYDLSKISAFFDRSIKDLVYVDLEKTDDKVYLSKNLKFLRYCYGMTQVDFSNLFKKEDESSRTVLNKLSSWETNKVFPRDKEIKRLCEFFNISEKELINVNLKANS